MPRGRRPERQFNHFPSKDELALQITLARREYWDYVLAELEPKADAMEGIEGAIRAAFRYQRNSLIATS